jgi:hypothetical protein
MACPAVLEDEPQAGFFAVRRFRYGEWVKGPFVPARIWIEPGEIDPETGELLSDERFAPKSTASPQPLEIMDMASAATDTA